jgi:hypothetical protein
MLLATLHMTETDPPALPPVALHGMDPTTEHYKGERRAGDECSLTPFFRLPLVPYLAAVGAPALPCQNLTCLIRRNHALSIHCNQHSATLNSRAIELGLLPAVPRFA